MDEGGGKCASYEGKERKRKKMLERKRVERKQVRKGEGGKERSVNR